MRRRDVWRWVNVLDTLSFAVLAVFVSHPLLWFAVGWYAHTTAAEW